MADDDKRRFSRVEFREAVQYRYPEKSSLNGSMGYDLSEGGVRFRTEDFIPVQSEVVVNLQLKTEREATLAARVVWVQKIRHADVYHVGCEFLGNRENVFPRFVVKNFLELHAG